MPESAMLAAHEVIWFDDESLTKKRKHVRSTEHTACILSNATQQTED